MEEQKTRNPWLGLESYKEGEVLFGRDDDICELTQCVLNDTGTLLYGKSGIGKSSIINAGVIPVARRHGYLPVLVRFSHKKQHTYLKQIKESIANSLMSIPLNGSGSQVELSISGRQKRKAELVTRMKEVVECKNSEMESLYELFHRYTFHDTDGKRIKLLIIFDQFEEIFTLQTDETKKKRFFTELADFLNDVMPTGLQHEEMSNTDSQKEIAVIGSGNFGNLFDDLNIGAEYNLPEYVTDNEIHMVFTIREDFLSEFEYYTASIPLLKQNRYGLRSINEEQAAQIIMRPIPGLISKPVSKMIIEKVTGRSDFKLEGIPKIEVNAALLSLYMKQLYERKCEKERIITFEHVQDCDDIIKMYYENSIKGISETTIAKLENELITNADKRDNVARIDLISKGISEDDLDKLIDKKILTQFSYGGDLRVEFIHDILCPIVVDRINHRELLVKENEARRIEEENRRIKLQNDRLNKIRSLFLSEKATNCYKDRYLAQMLALEALPTDIEHPDKPLVPQAEAALRKTIHIPYCPMIGHKDTVTRVLTTSDGRRILSLSRDNQVSIWEAFSGAQLKVLNCGDKTVTAISTCENGSTIVAVCSNGVVRLHLLDNFEIIAKFSMQGVSPKVLAIGPDGATIAIGTVDGYVVLYNRLGQEMLRSQSSMKIIDVLTFSPDNEELVIVGEGRMKSCSLKTGEWNSIEIGTFSIITCVSYSKNGKKLFCGTGNGKIIVLESYAGKRQRKNIVECEKMDCIINAISVSPDTKRIAYSVGGKMMVLEHNPQFGWSQQESEAQGKEYHYVKTNLLNDDFAPFITSITWSPDGRNVIWGNVEGFVSMFDTNAGPQHRELLKAKSFMKALKYGPNGDLLFCISNHSTFRVIDTKNGKELKKDYNYNKKLLETEFPSEDGNYLAICNNHRQVVELYSNIKKAKSFFAFEGEVTSIVFNSDSTLLAIAQNNGKGTCWDINNNCRKYPLNGYKSKYNTVLFSSKGGVFAITAPKGGVSICYESSGRLNYVIPAEVGDGYVYSLAFSPDGERLAIGTESGKIRIWNVFTKKQVDLLDRNKDGLSVMGMAFSPDGNQLSASYNDGAVIVWSCPSLKALIGDVRNKMKSRKFTDDEKRRYYLEDN